MLQYIFFRKICFTKVIGCTHLVLWKSCIILNSLLYLVSNKLDLLSPKTLHRTGSGRLCALLILCVRQNPMNDGGRFPVCTSIWLNSVVARPK